MAERPPPAYRRELPFGYSLGYFATPLRIPQGAMAESLHLAVAAGIALYQATRPAEGSRPAPGSW